jgi:hypothetical protein
MAIFKHKNGVVIASDLSLKNVADFKDRHPEMSAVGWEEGEAIVGQLWDGKALTNPTPDIDNQKATIKAQIKSRHAELLNKLTGDYSVEERDTWSMQLRWAQGYLADKNAAHAEFLAGMIPDAARQALPDPAQYMADKIMAKDAQAAKLTVIANRAKATANAAVDGAADQATLDAVLAALPDLETAALAELANA